MSSSEVSPMARRGENTATQWRRIQTQRKGNYSRERGKQTAPTWTPGRRLAGMERHLQGGGTPLRQVRQRWRTRRGERSTTPSTTKVSGGAEGTQQPKAATQRRGSREHRKRRRAGGLRRKSRRGGADGARRCENGVETDRGEAEAVKRKGKPR